MVVALRYVGKVVMKAWYATIPGEDFGIILYAETRGKALWQAIREWDGDREDFRVIRIRREVQLDGEPHTVTTLEYLNAGYWVYCDGCGIYSSPVYGLGEGEGYADEQGKVYCPACWTAPDAAEVSGTA